MLPASDRLYPAVVSPPPPNVVDRGDWCAFTDYRPPGSSSTSASVCFPQPPKPVRFTRHRLTHTCPQVTLWALQVQFLLQIIINRCSILLPNKRFAWRLKVGTAVIITAINITVYNIWVPARLQISERYIYINEWWDRIEKVFYLIIDSLLNIYFITIVQRNLVQNGLEKYRRLVLWNKFLIGFSLSMDVLIICMMSLSNTFVCAPLSPSALRRWEEFPEMLTAPGFF